MKKKSKPIDKRALQCIAAMAPRIYIERKCASCIHVFSPKKKVKD